MTLERESEERYVDKQIEICKERCSELRAVYSTDFDRIERSLERSAANQEELTRSVIKISMAVENLIDVTEDLKQKVNDIDEEVQRNSIDSAVNKERIAMWGSIVILILSQAFDWAGRICG